MHVEVRIHMRDRDLKTRLEEKKLSGWRAMTNLVASQIIRNHQTAPDILRQVTFR
jgi:hypothetical protein